MQGGDAMASSSSSSPGSRKRFKEAIQSIEDNADTILRGMESCYEMGKLVEYDGWCKRLRLALEKIEDGKDTNMNKLNQSEKIRLEKIEKKTRLVASDVVQLVISGGKETRLRNEINGLYAARGEHDGKKVFWKDLDNSASRKPVCIYFLAKWISDVGVESPPAWWIANDIGSEYFYFENRTDYVLPPRKGWGTFDEDDKVELNPSVSIAYKTHDFAAKPITEDSSPKKVLEDLQAVADCELRRSKQAETRAKDQAVTTKRQEEARKAKTVAAVVAERKAKEEVDRTAEKEVGSLLQSAKVLKKLESERIGREEAHNAERTARKDVARRAQEKEEKKAARTAREKETEEQEAARRAHAKDEEEKRELSEAQERVAKKQAEHLEAQEGKARKKTEPTRTAKEKDEEETRKLKDAQERQAKNEAERKAEEEAEKNETERKATAEAERNEVQRKKEESERKAWEDLERQAEEEADKRAAAKKADDAEKLKEEQERAAKIEAERRAKEEADRKADEQKEQEEKEAARRAQEQAERMAREDAERKTKAEADKIDAERKAEEAKQLQEAERRAKEQEDNNIEAERLRVEAEQQVTEEAKKKEAEQQAKLNADKKEAERQTKKDVAQQVKLEAEKRKAAKREAEELQAKEDAERKNQRAVEKLEQNTQERLKLANEKKEAEKKEAEKKETEKRQAIEEEAKTAANKKEAHKLMEERERHAKEVAAETKKKEEADKTEPERKRKASEDQSLQEAHAERKCKVARLDTQPDSEEQSIRCECGWTGAAEARFCANCGRNLHTEAEEGSVVVNDVNYYEVLGVPHDAGASAIKKAFHKKNKLLHPDKNRDDPTCKEKFQLVTEAHQALIDTERRLRHDAELFIRRCRLSSVHDQYERAVAVAERHLSIPGRVLRAKEIPPAHIKAFISGGGQILKQMKHYSAAEFRVLPSAFILCAGTEDQVVKGEEQINDIVAKMQPTAPSQETANCWPRAVKKKLPRGRGGGRGGGNDRGRGSTRGKKVGAKLDVRTAPPKR